MNEIVKCNRLKGSRFKNNKQKILLYKNLERTIVPGDYKDNPELIKAPGLYSVASVGLSTRKQGSIVITLLSPCVKLINYKTFAATIT